MEGEGGEGSHRIDPVTALLVSGEEKLLTKCHHESTGPPLKSFLFDIPPDSDGFAEYAHQTMRAVDHVIATFPGLR